MADFPGVLVTNDDVQVFGARVQHDVIDRASKLVTVSEQGGTGDVQVFAASRQHDQNDLASHLLTNDDVKTFGGTVQHDVTDRPGQLVLTE